jgi:long-chain acyl-CoA synthetase
VIADFNKLATDNKFSGLERIKQVHISLEPFSIENDMLTPTMKIKRNIAQKVF